MNLLSKLKTTKREDALNKLLVKNSFPAMCIHSGLSQSERISHFEDFKLGVTEAE